MPLLAAAVEVSVWEAAAGSGQRKPVSRHGGVRARVRTTFRGAGGGGVRKGLMDGPERGPRNEEGAARPPQNGKKQHGNEGLALRDSLPRPPPPQSDRHEPPPPPGMHWKGGYPPPSSRAPSLCPATVPLTASVSFNGIGDRQ